LIFAKRAALARLSAVSNQPFAAFKNLKIHLNSYFIDLNL